MLLCLLMQLLRMKCSPRGESVRTISDGTEGRILRSHVDVWGVADVAWHSYEGRARQVPIGGENFVFFGQSELSDEEGRGWIEKRRSMGFSEKLPVGLGEGYGPRGLYVCLRVGQTAVTHSRWRGSLAQMPELEVKTGSKDERAEHI